MSTELEQHMAVSKLLSQHGDLIADKVASGLADRLDEIGDRIEAGVRAAVEEALNERAAENYAKGLVQGIQMLLTEDKDHPDTSVIKRFWKTGYRELTTAASTNASQWVGKKILVAVIAALFVWSMTMLAKHGAFK